MTAVMLLRPRCKWLIVNCNITNVVYVMHWLIVSHVEQYDEGQNSPAMMCILDLFSGMERNFTKLPY
jgi:hypothetical protein